MKWAGRAGRREGVHMVHTFEEIRARTPCKLQRGCSGRHHAAGGMEGPPPRRGPGLGPPYTPQTLRRWLEATDPRAWAIGAPQAPPPPHHRHTGKGKGTGKARARDRKGHSGKGATKGPK